MIRAYEPRLRSTSDSFGGLGTSSPKFNCEQNPSRSETLSSAFTLRRSFAILTSALFSHTEPLVQERGDTFCAIGIDQIGPAAS
jgi:hypothetical protein